jgi:hypothetical protein
VFHMDVAKIDRDVAHVAMVVHICCKCLVQMFHLLFQAYVANVLIWMLHIFHIYVARVCSNCFAISVLCCNKYFHVVSYKCFMWMFHMFHAHVASVCSKYFIRFRRMLHSSASCFKDMFRESRGHGPCVEGRGAASWGPADGVHTWCPADEACSSSSWLSGAARAEREEGGESASRPLVGFG